MTDNLAGALHGLGDLKSLTCGSRLARDASLGSVNSPIRLILASQSPRRSELLRAAGIEHLVRAVPVDEAIRPAEEPSAYVCRLAQDKAQAVPRAPGEIVLGADTSVVCDGGILGKPADSDDAARMLRLLSGKAHDVITGVCLLHGTASIVEHATTRVVFDQITERQIAEYVESGEPNDKAGAYAIQGIAARYIDRIEGSYSNVVGLPIALVWRALESIRNSLS